MTFVGVFGLVLGLLGGVFAFVRRSHLRMTMLGLLYVMHVAAAVVYYRLAEGGVADSALYYYDWGDMFGGPFEFNTVFIVYLVQAPKSVFGGTYLDYFLVFQAFGFWGLALFMRTFEEIYQEAGVEQPFYVYLILFMPSLHYWTSSIGKDSLFFLGICVTLWASMQYKRRLVPLAVGMLLLLFIRPHVAAIVGAAFAISVLMDRDTRLSIKLPLFALSAAGTVYAVASVWSTFQIDVTDVDTYSDMLSGREALLETEEAGRTAVTGSFPIRVLSLLFRPFFFDSGGALGLIVSVENLLLLFFVLIMLFNLRTMWAVSFRVPFVRYALVSSLVITLVLAIGYYNVGLGIRQKATMILPGLLVAFIALQALRAARAKAARPAGPAIATQPSFG